MLQTFITRPRFALVISIVIVLAGLASLKVIPVEQLPDITPPVVNVSAVYPGASAQDVLQAIAGPVEEEVNGVENMLYMESTSSNSGAYQLNITFALGTDPEMAAVEVQNRVAQVSSRLPAQTVEQGVLVRARSNNILLTVGLYSPDGSFDQLALSNYASSQVQDVIARLPGVSEARLMGARDYAMRIWMNPRRMDALDVSVEDILKALREQHVLAAAGQVGSPPDGPGQEHTLAIVAQGRLKTPEEFANIFLRATPGGAAVRLGDVARVGLGAENYRLSASFNNQPMALIGIYPSPGANALQLSNRIKDRMEKLSLSFPKGVSHSISFDSTKFISESLKEVLFSLSLTLIIVLAVVYCFLQSGKAILIVASIIPVSLIGTFSFLLVTGYTINSLTLFAIILALTMVVDDAIVVVENVERIMEEDASLSGREAAVMSLKEIAGPIIATTMVLLAVFVPVLALPGITGNMFRQFAVTITVALCLSSLCALTLSPALCAALLKRRQKKANRFFAAFNSALERTRQGYVRLSAYCGGRAILPATAVVLALAVGVFCMRAMETGFLPEEDQGYLFINLQLPDGASLSRTESISTQVKDMTLATEGVEDMIFINGFSMLNATEDSNTGFGFIVLKPWGERDHATDIIARLRARYNTVNSASVAVMNPPAILGLGNTSGFDLRIRAEAGQSVQELANVSRSAVLAGNAQPGLQAVFSTFSASVPQLHLEVNRAAAARIGVPLSRIFSTLQAGFGGIAAGDIEIDNRIFRVLVQNDLPFRDRRDQIPGMMVRSDSGRLVRLDTLVTVTPTVGAPFVQRYNMFPSVSVFGSPAAGHSSGEALDVMEGVLASTLPDGYGFAWSGISFQERQIGSQQIWIYLAALVFAYLFLVAQYESWTIPLSVLLSVSFAVGGALLCLWAFGFANDVYVQIGLIMLVGIAAKNAILVVEFARQKRLLGASVAEAALEGARTRYRAVMMTAVSFILGILPLVLATGAGAASRRVIGATVFFGMLAATAVGIFFIPGLYKWIQTLAEWKRPEKSALPQRRGQA